MKICIPSKGRANKITTLNFIDVSRFDVEIYVDSQDFNDYAKFFNNNRVKVIDIGSNNMGVAHVRDYILQHNFGTIAMLDDDIKTLKRRTDITQGLITKYEDIFNLDEILYRAEVLMTALNAVLYGLSYYGFVRFSTNLYDINKQDRCFIVMNCDKIKELGIHYDSSMILNEDIDFQLQLIHKNLLTVRDNYYAVISSYNIPGDCYDARASLTEHEGYKLIENKWGRHLFTPLIKNGQFRGYKTRWSKFSKLNS